MNEVYLGLGSNIYPRIYYLYCALNQIQKNIGKITKKSSVYETEPWRMTADTPFFYNMCVQLYTNQSPVDVLNQAQNIEKILLRKKKNSPQNYESRTIDIDILLYNDEIHHTNNLKIPHPLMHLRSFVLLPLSEIAPDIIHPVLKTKIKDL